MVAHSAKIPSQKLGTSNNTYSYTQEKIISDVHMTQCNHSCTRATHLKAHMLTHSGQKSFTCSLCNYSCTTAGDLKQHLLIHSGKKPFNCMQCNYSCTTASHLQRHMQKHSGDKPFSCIQCNFPAQTRLPQDTHVHPFRRKVFQFHTLYIPTPSKKLLTSRHTCSYIQE